MGIFAKKIMGCIVGIDYGSKRTGLATTDPMQIIASSLITLPTTEVISFLKTYSDQAPIEAFVVGQPIQKDGSSSFVEIQIAQFITALESEFPNCKVDRYDERFTSKLAVQTILQSGVKKKKRMDKTIIDRVSATLILQSYLDYKSKKI